MTANGRAVRVLALCAVAVAGCSPAAQSPAEPSPASAAAHPTAGVTQPTLSEEASVTRGPVTMTVRWTPEVVAGETAWLEATVSTTAPVAYEGGPGDCDRNVTAIAARTEPLPSDPPATLATLDPVVIRAYDLLMPASQHQGGGAFRSEVLRKAEAGLDAQVPPFPGRSLWTAVGCTLPLVSWTLEPGRPITDRMDWSTTVNGAPIEPGDQIVTVMFPLASLEVPLRVTAPDGPRILTIDEAAHALLSDPRVVETHHRVPIERWGGHALEYIDGTWYYLLRYDDSQLLVATADGHTGEVLDVHVETHTGR